MQKKLEQLFHSCKDKINYLIYLLPFIIFILSCLQAYSNSLSSIEIDGSSLILKVDGISCVKIRGNNSKEVTITLPNTVINETYNEEDITNQLQQSIPSIESVKLFQYSLEPAETRIVIKSQDKLSPKISQDKESDKITISLSHNKKEEIQSSHLQPKIDINSIVDHASISKELEEVIYLRANGNLNEAKIKIENILSKSPEDIWANYYLSLIYIDENQLETAQKINEKILKKNPNFFASCYTMAIINDITGNIDNAIELYKKVNSIFPEYQDSHYRLGLDYLKKNEYSLAELEFKRTLTIYSEHSGAMQNLGMIYLKQFNIDKATEYFKKAIRTDAINNLGNIFIQDSDNKNALRYLTFALTLDPNNAILNYNLGKVYHSMDLYEEALKCYSKAIELDPAMYNAHYNLAMIYTIQGKNDKAVDEFTAYINLNLGANDLEEVNSLISRLQSQKNEKISTF